MSSTAFSFETPQTVFYPSLVVNLQLRFDEGLTLIPGAVSARDLSDPNFVGPPAPPTTQPVVLAPTSKDNLSQIIGLIPKTCTVELPGYRQAGTFTVDLEFRDLPLDPRVIRALAVAIHLGSVPASDWGSSMTSLPDVTQLAGKRRSIITTKPSNLVLSGLADEVVVTHSDSGAFVHIEGRDLRGILLDTSIDSLILDGFHPEAQTIQQVVQYILSKHPQGLGIVVELNNLEWPGGLPPIPSSLTDVTRANLSALGAQVRAFARGDANKMSFWDLITYYCFLVGGVPYFVGSKLRIRRAKSLFDVRAADDPSKAFDPANPTPFVNGRPRVVKPPVAQKPEQFGYRRLVYGKDIRQLKFERKLGGVKVPVVECVSYDMGLPQKGINPLTGEPYGLLKAQFPPLIQKGARVTSIAPGGGAPQTSVLRISVPGIKNLKKLKQLAEELYHEIGRQEMGGSIETRNLTSFGGTNQDPDLLNLRPGDAIELRVDASSFGVFPPPVSELTNADGRSFEAQVKAVRERIGDENLARVLVAVNRGEVAQLQRTFRVANVRFDWGVSGGIGIAFDFQNFLEARYAVEGGG